MSYASRSCLQDRVFQLTVVISLVASACVEPESPSEPVISSFQPIESPAGPNSGEPYLAATGNGVVLSWLEETQGGSHALRVSTLEDTGWSAPVTVVERDDLFVNWADFPVVSEVGPGVLAAHWLQRGGKGTYDYGVRVVFSRDGGVIWSPPWTPHEDETPTEHGFVSFTDVTDGLWGVVWLDGRKFHAPAGEVASEEMTLRFRTLGPDGVPGDEVVIDERICDCCQTDAAVTSRGPLVVYRDRSDEEIRDIYVTRLVDGKWTEGVPVHGDGWHIEACPVNGPAAAASGDRVAVAWFTGAADTARVKVAFSEDSGETFSAPQQVDDGNPAGRVDVLMLEDGSALVSWLERTAEGVAEVRARRVSPDGPASAPVTISTSSDARTSGFPRMTRAADGSIVIAWTDTTGDVPQVKVARAEVREP